MAHLSTDGLEVDARAAEVLPEAMAGYREVLLASELMMARQQQYDHPCLFLARAT